MEKRKLMLAQDNAITKARYKFDLIEKRCVYQILGAIRRDYVETNNRDRMHFENLIIRLTPDQLDKCIEGERNRRKVYQSLKKLNAKQLEFENAKEWYVCHFINYARHDRKTDTYEVEVSKLILPYLVDLVDHFTTFDLSVALTFSSRYTQRFYEFCCMYRNTQQAYFFMSFDELRVTLGLKDQYNRFFNFKKRVLDVAENEMKQSYEDGVADIYFTWKENKKIPGRIDFYVHQKRDERQAQIEYDLATQATGQIISTLKIFFPRDKKFVKRVQTALMINPQTAFEIRDKIQKKVLDYPKRDIPKILRYVLQEDFGMK
ncbi:hypothetical protein BHU16_07175 [Tannerella sp. oral taxon 808]|nr:hypothetical protein BHU16_07175 [Tannerella sp. oral taxon 808]